MPTGDGLLARVHPPLGILTAGQARAVADAARRFGNGHIDVTARANLQIRGVTEATSSPLAAFLTEAGLGDRRDDGGPQRLTLTPPLAGHDVMALAWAIEEIGLEIPGLPAKTLVAVEEAGSPFAASLAANDADIRIVLDNTAPIPGRAERQRSTIRERAAGAMAAGACRVALAGPDGLAWFACKFQEDAVSVVDVALRSLAVSGARRMRDLPATERNGLIRASRDHLVRVPPVHPTLRPHPEAPGRSGGLERGLQETHLALEASFEAADAAPQDEGAGGRTAVCGVIDLGDGGTALAIDSPFGRCGADSLDRLADEAEGLASDIHLSPSRGFVLLSSHLVGAERAQDALAKAGFITTAHDPRTAVAACPGAPACASGSTATLADAARLADVFRPFAERGLRAHVSGCAKGCAHPAAADLTLVGVAGLYGIVVEGAPSALPATQLTFEAALERLRRADPSTPLSHAFRTTP
ncbi:MAG: hypothetical protein K2Y56_10695 [Methylobacterium sp.]|nr:hypothetical protein [Methylobacterium sp.]